MSPSSSLNIGIFLSTLGQVRGGLETHATYLSKELAKRGHQITIVSGSPPQNTLPSELKSLPVRWIATTHFPVNHPIWSPLARIKPGWPLKIQSLSFVFGCHLHPHVRELVASTDVTLSYLEIETVLISTWRKRWNKPHVSYFPGGIEWGWLRRDQSVVRIAISSAVAQALQKEPKFRIDGVTPPGIPASLLTHPYTVRPEAHTLIFAGRLEANKGVMELLEIMKTLASVHPHLHLRILGDGPMRKSLEVKIRQMNMADRISCLGAIPPDQVWEEFRNADIFVFPTQYESYGMVALEAQAIGIPIVCSDIPTLKAIVGDTGKLIPLGEQGLWHKKIHQLILDQKARKNMSLAGRRRARDFSWARAAEEIEAYLFLAMSRYPG